MRPFRVLTLLTLMTIMSSCILFILRPIDQSSAHTFQYRGMTVKNIDLYNKYSNDNINELIDRYKVTSLIEQNLYQKICISRTAIPRDFKNIRLIGSHFNFLHIPVTYSMGFEYHDNQLPKGVIINKMKSDFGPASKILGMCSVEFSLCDVIIYLDSDITYDETILIIGSKIINDSYILGSLGGVYPVTDLKGLSTLEVGLYDSIFGCCPNKGINVDVVYGYGGVYLTRLSLQRLCKLDFLTPLRDCPTCKWVDDEYVSWLYMKLSLPKLVTRSLYPIINDDWSNSNPFSNRGSYKQLANRCLKCLTIANDQHYKPRIVIPIIRSMRSHLMNSKEYDNDLFMQKQIEFFRAHNLEYQYIKETKLKKPHWAKIEIIRNFLTSCKLNDVLFYSDFDFYFISDDFPIFKDGRSLIISRGCDVDFLHLMVGNMIIKCDQALINLIDSWEKATEIMSEVELNDDQISFNLIYPRFSTKIQVEFFMTYDFCPNKPSIGYHFPGENKLERLLSLIG